MARRRTPRSSRSMRGVLLASLLLLLAGLAQAAAPDFGELDRAIRDGELGSVKSLLIARDGELVFERYYRGNNADTLFLVNSVTKSLGATLVGILHREGRLRLDQPLQQLLPQYDWVRDFGLNPNRDLRLDHVLTMRTGLLWDEWSTDYRDPENSMAALLASSDWYRHVLRLPKEHAVGEEYRYNTGVSTLMSAIVSASSGLSPQEFARTRLFEPLGIDDFHVEGWSSQGRGHGITDFPFDEAPLGFAWWLRARDLLKLGELHRLGGVWEGQRLLDREWIIDAWSHHSHAGNSTLFAANPQSGYGYQWWLTQFTDARGRTWNSVYADGWGRQYVFVFPDLHLTVVTTSDDYDYDGPGIGFALRNLVLHQFDPVLDARFTGSWYDPALPGQGLQVEVLEQFGVVAAYWFTYDDEGRQQWFLAQGPIGEDDGAGGAELVVYRPVGGRFMGPDPHQLDAVGEARLAFSDCDHGSLVFTIDGEAGEYAIQRLTGSCASPLLGPPPVVAGKAGQAPAAPAVAGGERWEGIGRLHRPRQRSGGG